MRPHMLAVRTQGVPFSEPELKANFCADQRKMFKSRHTPTARTEYLNDLRHGSEDKRGISAQTFNFYLGAIKQFCRFMVKDHRALENPLAHLDSLNVKTDRRRDRRALIVAALLKLLNTATTAQSATA